MLSALCLEMEQPGPREVLNLPQDAQLVTTVAMELNSDFVILGPVSGREVAGSGGTKIQALPLVFTAFHRKLVLVVAGTLCPSPTPTVGDTGHRCARQVW